MKYFILFIFSIFTLTSCFHSKMLPKEETVIKDVEVPYDTIGIVELNTVSVFEFTSWDVVNFIYDKDDNITVYYDFYGQESTNGALKFKIENKTDQNIFIDLAYSSFINNNRATNYTDAVDITGKVLLIPDHSYLDLTKFEGITSANKKEIENLIKETYESDAKFKTFTKAKSPLSIRNKITYGFKESITNPKIIDNKFWVSKLYVYNKSDFNLLNKADLKNKLIYSCNFMGKGKVTKYRVEKKPVKQTVIKKTKVFNLGGTIVLGSFIILGVILVLIGSGA